MPPKPAARKGTQGVRNASTSTGQRTAANRVVRVLTVCRCFIIGRYVLVLRSVLEQHPQESLQVLHSLEKEEQEVLGIQVEVAV